MDDVAFAYSIVYLQTCQQASSDDTRALIAAHEMTHGMGAVPTEAPHSCNSGHVCDSPSDLMKAVFQQGDSLGNVLLDVGRDDYYAHAGNWWDVRNSGLLYDLDQSLAPAPDDRRTSRQPTTRASSASTGRLRPRSRVSTTGSTTRTERSTNDDQETTELTTSGTIGQIFTLDRPRRDRRRLPEPSRHAPFQGRLRDRRRVRGAAAGHGPAGAVTDLRADGREGEGRAPLGEGRRPIGLRGYRVTVAGRPPLFVTGTTASFPRTACGARPSPSPPSIARATSARRYSAHAR